MAIHVLYFAWLRERAGRTEETVEPPAHVATVRDLIGWLRTSDEARGTAFAEPGLIRCALNQEFASLDARLSQGDEVAFFPPVTGG